MTFPQLDRRRFLWNAGGGLGGIALAHLLGTEGVLAEDRTPRETRDRPRGGLHHPARASRVIEFFMSGAASQCDLYDYKPLLIKKHGDSFNPGGKVELFQSDAGRCDEEPMELETVRRVRQVDEQPGASPGRRASMTWRSCPRWSRSPTCMVRRPSFKTRASCCRGFPALAPGSLTGWAA